MGFWRHGRISNFLCRGETSDWGHIYIFKVFSIRIMSLERRYFGSVIEDPPSAPLHRMRRNGVIRGTVEWKTITKIFQKTFQINRDGSNRMNHVV